jgi:Trypsin/Bacterial Ig domain
MVWCVGAAFAGDLVGSDVADDSLRPDTPTLVAPPIDAPVPSGVVGGKPVKQGKWDDTVGVVFFSAYVGCTGTLVGPRVVLTAGHCVVGTDVSHVLIGSKDWFDASQGELIEVEEAIEYPSSWNTFDIAVLLLAEPSSYEPRPIGLECILDAYLDDGAPVQIVGFGGTQSDGRDYSNTELNEVATEVLDKNCSEDRINGILAGCNEAARPAGELAAGGEGEDACFGDSGGPLYLKTEVGDYVVGVTSRAFLGASYFEPCTDGGIWVRPDAVIEWIEDVSGGKKLAYPSCNEPPEVTLPELNVRRDHARTVVAEVADPDGDDTAAVLAVGQPPEFGTVTIEGRAVTYTPNAGYLGEDSFTLTVTDAGSDFRRTGDPVTTEVDVPVTVRRSFLGLGCASSPVAATWLALGLLAPLARRRR